MPLIESILIPFDELPAWVIAEYPLYAVSPPNNLSDTLDEWAKTIETPYAALIDGYEMLEATTAFQQTLTHHEINLLLLCASNISSSAVVEVRKTLKGIPEYIF